jgi:hypothetical protein
MKKRSKHGERRRSSRDEEDYEQGLSSSWMNE